MSARSAPYFATRTALIEDHVAYGIDRSRGHARDWSRRAEDAEPIALPPRITTLRRTATGAYVAPAAPPVEQSRKVLLIGQRTTVVRKPVASAARSAEVVNAAPVNQAELDAERVQLLSVLAARKAELECEEADRVRRETEAAEAAEAQRLAVELRTERAELIARARIVDAEVFALIWVGQRFTHEQIIAWIETLSLPTDIAKIRNVRGHLEKQIQVHAEAKAKAEADREAEVRWAEAARKAAEERKRLARPADRSAVAALAQANQPKREHVEVAKPVGKKPGFNIFDVLRASVGKPVVAAAPPPSAAELAELERRVNGQAQVTKIDSGSTSAPTVKFYQGPRVVAPLTLRERIQCLDPKVVARLHRDGRQYGAYRWPTIERMLEVEKVGTWHGRGEGEKTREGLERFVARCEQG